jgi:uracil-DNA glycosylase family 4
VPLEKPSLCTGCPAYATGRGYVPGKGPLGARIALVGQGPGEVEYHAGEPFVGPAGQLLDRELAQANLHRADLWVDNAVRCWLPANRAPRQAEVDHCRRAHWGPALAELRELRVVVPVGVPAARAFLGRTAGEGVFGTPFRHELP